MAVDVGHEPGARIILGKGVHDVARLEPRAGAAVINRLSTFDAVERAHTTSGHYDMALQLATGSTRALDDALAAIAAIPGVVEAESLIHLSTKLDRRP